MKIRAATNSDRNIIKDLWIDLFSDSPDYVDFYLDRRWKPENCALLEENGDIFGMAHLLPCKIAPNHKALYWYAVGIRSDKRNQGYFRYFVTNLLKITQTKGYFNVCMPASGLETVYQRFGFRFPYTGSHFVFCQEHHKDYHDILIQKARVSDFEPLYQKEGSVVWDCEAAKYALIENELNGGKNFIFEFHNRIYFGTAIKKNDHYLIDNTNLDVTVFEYVKNSFFQFLQTNKIVLIDSGKEDAIVGLSDFENTNLHSRISFTLA